MLTSVFSPECRAKISPCSFSLVALLVSLAGCPGDDDGPDANPADVMVELGGGAVDFQPLVGTTPDLVLEAGPQGGHHFIVNARMRGFIPGDPSMPGLLGNPATLFSAFTEDGSQIDLMFPPYRLGYQQDDDGFFYLPSGRILQVDEDVVDSLIGQAVLLRVNVRDAQGLESSDERMIIATEPPPGTPDAGPLADGS